jgi:hypothetical protein
MREAFGNLWDLAAAPNTVVCIATNGYVNSRGECVMGRGTALQAKKRYPGIARNIGNTIKAEGNHVRVFNVGTDEAWLLIFPTKHVWWRPSDLLLIEQSAKELADFAAKNQHLTFYLPRPGCANGGLNWADVKPVLESVGLPDNVVVIDKEAGYDTGRAGISGGV